MHEVAGLNLDRRSEFVEAAGGYQMPRAFQKEEKPLGFDLAGAPDEVPYPFVTERRVFPPV